MFLKKISSHIAYPIVIMLCLLAAGLMLGSALHDSAIDDELAHIPAGYSYVHNLDGRLNPEHPPLLKMIAELPVLAFLKPTFPSYGDAWNGVNGQWDMGRMFLYESGSDADAIIHLSRVGPILLTLLLILLVYFWSAQLFGTIWGLLPTALIALSPTVLAHGHYVTTDIAATFGITLATYFFLKYLKTPVLKNLIFAGLAFGIAQSMKFSAVLLIPYFLALGILLILLSFSWKQLVRTLARIISIIALGYILVVYPLYTILTTHYPPAKQITDTTFILGSFAGGSTAAGTHCSLMRCVAEADIWMTKHTLTRPFAHYLLGVLMVIQRSSAGNTGYFLGTVSASGSHLYFPVVYLLKEPLPTLFIILGAFALALAAVVRSFRRSKGARLIALKEYIASHFPQVSMALFVAFYWAWSVKSPLNIGVRHLLPTFPFMAMLATGVWKTAGSFRVVNFSLIAPVKRLLASFLKYIGAFALLLWLLLETTFVSPYFLSYFNEVGGGVKGGYKYVVDSNYDWGQDLGRLTEWIEKNQNQIPGKIAVDYFGGGNPKYYLGDKVQDWSSAQGNPVNAGIEWLAVSINTLQSAMARTAPGFERKPEDEYRWLSDARGTRAYVIPQPDIRIGTSIFVYHLK